MFLTLSEIKLDKIFNNSYKIDILLNS